MSATSRISSAASVPLWTHAHWRRRRRSGFLQGCNTITPYLVLMADPPPPGTFSSTGSYHDGQSHPKGVYSRSNVLLFSCKCASHSVTPGCYSDAGRNYSYPGRGWGEGAGLQEGLVLSPQGKYYPLGVSYSSTSSGSLGNRNPLCHQSCGWPPLPLQPRHLGAKCKW